MYRRTANPCSTVLIVAVPRHARLVSNCCKTSRYYGQLAALAQLMLQQEHACAKLQSPSILLTPIDYTCDERGVLVGLPS